MMVNVQEKAVTYREAWARCVVKLPAAVVAQLKDGDIQSKKGPVFHTAIIAGTMAVKKTSELIPFCHPLPIEDVKISIEPGEGGQLLVRCKVATHYKTGVEMEALMGAQMTALTIYDMCKALSHDMKITDLELMSKHGGKRDFERGIGAQ